MVKVNLSKLHDEEFKRRYGAYDTPPHIVDLMIKLTGIRDFSGLKVCEPACGLAPFARAISRIKGSWKDIVGVEVDPDIAEIARRLHPELDVRVGDYLLMDLGEEFDLVIGNPPYGIIGSETHYAISAFKQSKQAYRRLYRTWFGKYNIYGLFVEKGVRDLREGGTLCFIIPATWMILDEFRKLREFLASSGKLEVYYLGKGVFKGLNVSVVILVVRKGGRGLELYEVSGGRIALNHARDSYGGEMIAFESELTRRIESTPHVRLGDVFDIRISPRSTEVRSCPFLSRERGEGYVPLLSGKNLSRRGIDYESCYSGYYIRPEDIGRLRGFFLRDRVVVGHTKGGRLVSAIDYRHYAWTGDVYHLMPKQGLFAQEFPLQDLNYILSSELMNRYMREKYREITPHVTKTQLRMLPLIRLEEFKALESSLKQAALVTRSGFC